MFSKHYQQNKITWKVNNSILRTRECTLRLRSCAPKVFGVQLYKNNARAHILSILNSDWRRVSGVYEYKLIWYILEKEIMLQMYDNTLAVTSMRILPNALSKQARKPNTPIP